MAKLFQRALPRAQRACTSPRSCSPVLFYFLKKIFGCTQWQPTPVFLPGESQGRGAWWAAVCGVAQSRTRLKRLSSKEVCGTLGLPCPGTGPAPPALESGFLTTAPPGRPSCPLTHPSVCGPRSAGSGQTPWTGDRSSVRCRLMFSLPS